MGGSGPGPRTWAPPGVGHGGGHLQSWLEPEDWLPSGLLAVGSAHGALSIGQRECLLPWLLGATRVSDAGGTETNREASGPFMNSSQKSDTLTFSVFCS